MKDIISKGIYKIDFVHDVNPDQRSSKLSNLFYISKPYRRLETQDEDGETRSNLHLYC